MLLPLKLFPAGLLLATLSCAGGPQPLRVGPEVQAYPAGVVAGVHIQLPIATADAVFLRLAANITDRQDFGEHDNEEGEGYGLGFGWRHYQQQDHSGWLYGARADLWSMEIDWRDDSGTPRSGTTEMLVFQPSVEGGYAWRLGDGSWSMDLTAGLGAEINFGEDSTSSGNTDVGEGAIFLLGVTFLYNQ